MSLLSRFDDRECRAWFAALVAIRALPAQRLHGRPTGSERPGRRLNGPAMPRQDTRATPMRERQSVGADSSH